MKKPYVILVLYYTRGIYPLRDTIRTHLYCHERYSQHRYVYVNLAFGFPWGILKRMRIAGVIFHTICLSMRWSPAIFRERTALLAPLEILDVPKLAMPQDEFIHTDLLAQFLERQRITHLFTCATEADWRKIYGEFLDLERVKVKTTLTGYIDEDTLRRVDQMKRRQGKLLGNCALGRKESPPLPPRWSRRGPAMRFSSALATIASRLYCARV